VVNRLNHLWLAFGASTTGKNQRDGGEKGDDSGFSEDANIHDFSPGMDRQTSRDPLHKLSGIAGFAK
jgi:hypothetical protein